MNHRTALGMILWGLIVFAIGLANTPLPTAGEPAVPAQDALFLVTGGMLSCMIGLLGLLGVLGWIPGFRKEKQSAA